MALRSTDILTQTPQGLYCPLGDFHIDPVRPVKRALITHGHSDHARSGHRSVMATRETLRIMGVRYGEDFAGLDPGGRLGREHPPRRRDGALHAGRPCAGLGADRHRGRRHPRRGVGRLQARRGPDLPALRGRALRRLHHRGDVRPAGVPPPRHAGRGAQAPRFRRPVSRTRPYRRRLCARQGAAGHGAPARGRLRPADPSPWRHGAPDRALQVRRHSLGRDAEGRGRRALEARRAPS